MKLLATLCALRVPVVFFLCASLCSLWLFAFAEEPARGLAALKVPDGFTVEVAAPPEMSSYPMFMEFDHQGRLFIAESSGKNTKGKDTPTYPECMILMLEDTDKDGVFDKRTVFADKLSLPMGVLWYRGAIYCASPPDFFRFEDTDGDGVADKKDVILTGWNVLNTASLHGPFLGPDGYMYLTHGRHGYNITTPDGLHYEGQAARIWRCKPDGTKLERFCGGGFDNPVELVWLDNGDMIGTMTYFTEPRQGQRDALNHWVEGGVYPKPHEVIDEFVRTGDLMPSLTKFSRIAPAGLMVYRGANFGDEYKGNLFSAQFNPHRVQRHIFKSGSETGSSYTSEDSDFLSSTDPDFHPTDAIEDADGTVLVSDTGGWYVDACPISRVAKPEIRGSIYRVRKIAGARQKDGWGSKLNIPKASTKKLISLLGDPRLHVREAALEQLVLVSANDESSVQSLREAFEESCLTRRAMGGFIITYPDDDHSETIKNLIEASRRSENLASALVQVGTPRALTALREIGLAQSVPELRQLTAELLGTVRDADAVKVLIPLLNDSFPGVRRVAAASLGRLRAKEAVAPLLRAADSGNDRFLEHAITFALIQINDQEPLRAALSAENPAARKAAFIALDQLKSDKLTAEHALAFLNSDSEDLRKTGLWVASRHPDWADRVLASLQEKVNAPDFAPETAEGIGEVILAYAQYGNVQQFMAHVAGDDAAPAARRLFMLDAIEKMNLNPLPEPILQSVGKSLQSGDESIRYRAATLIAARSIGSFDEQLLALADNANETPALRISALGAVQTRAPELNDARFAFLAGNLSEKTDPAVRLSAGKVIGHAKLTNDQLRALADAHLPKADALTFPALLDAFKNGADEAVGNSLVKSLSNAAIAPSMIPGGLDALLATYPDSVKLAAAPLRAQIEAEEKARLEKLAAIEPLIGKGDVGRGRHLFFNEKIACSTCHTVGAEGGTVGPDLTTIGAIRSGHDLLEAILFPNASFVPGYESMRISAKDPEFGGDVEYVGVIGEQTADAVLLRQNAKDSVRISRKDITAMDQAPNSIMPQGLDTGMTQEQLLDLLAFLQSLNNEQWLLPERRETAKAAH
ncbi:MAG: HEAT repeat domain-containing protein [Candidatus Hydrogenedentes bacterium]|nr:HEAT repeat domain-containing protein [Candidatus Hydrogenedentota bacterium]